MKTFYTNRNNFRKKFSRISWGAILAGALTAFSLAFLLNLLGWGIGLTSINPFTDMDPFQGLGIATLIWWILSNLAALFVGGLVAARTAGLPSSADGGIHGFLSWGVYLVVSVFVLTSIAGSTISGMGSLVSSVFGSNSAKEVVVNLNDKQKQSEEGAFSSFERIKQEMFQVIQTAENYNIVPGDTKERAQRSINEVETETSRAIKDLNLKDAISDFVNDIDVNLDNEGNLDITVEGDGNYINAEKLKAYLADNTDLTEEQIEGVVNKWERNLDEAVQKAKQLYATAKTKALKASEEVADAVGKASIYLFFILLLGALAAFFGGATGAPQLSVEEERRKEIIEDVLEEK